MNSDNKSFDPLKATMPGEAVLKSGKTVAELLPETDPATDGQIEGMKFWCANIIAKQAECGAGIATDMVTDVNAILALIARIEKGEAKIEERIVDIVEVHTFSVGAGSPEFNRGWEGAAKQILEDIRDPAIIGDDLQPDDREYRKRQDEEILNLRIVADSAINHLYELANQAGGTVDMTTPDRELAEFMRLERLAADYAKQLHTELQANNPFGAAAIDHVADWRKNGRNARASLLGGLRRCMDSHVVGYPMGRRVVADYLQSAIARIEDDTAILDRAHNRQADENLELHTVLKPFAEADEADSDCEDDECLYGVGSITYGDLRAARVAVDTWAKRKS